MAKKIIGTILFVVGGALIVVLLTYGGPVFPHIIGPGLLVLIGAILLTVKRKAGKPTN